MAEQMVCLQDFEDYVLNSWSKQQVELYTFGAEEGYTADDNLRAFKRYRLLPRVLKDVSSVDMTTAILGHTIAFPLGISPTAFQLLANPQGEIGAAKGAGMSGTVYTASTYSSTMLSDLGQHTANVHKFFQMVLPHERDPSRPVTRQMLKEAEDHGFSAIVLSVDFPVHGPKWHLLRNKFVFPSHVTMPIMDHYLESGVGRDEPGFEHDKSLTWAIIGWLKSVTRLPIVLKGILTPADAALAADHGVAAVWVSNHGGRQLDTTPATIDVLEPVVRAVAGRCEVYLDCGIRCGSDIFKALALGANVVFIGRPAVYGLAYDGMVGVHKVLEILKAELLTAMSLAGCCKLSDISRDHVVHESEYEAKL